MRRIWTRLLLGAIACLVLAAPLAAQVAPTVTGETGLFQVMTADMLPQGRFSLGLSWGLWNRTAASVPYAAPLPDDPLRYDLQRFGLSVGYGLMPNWEATVSTGSNRYHASSFNWQGLVNGHYRFGGFKHSDIVTRDKRLAAYVERCTARPAFKRAFDAQIGDFKAAA